jgi:DNA-binding LacI/PurR family transcriptional regulator
MGKVLRRVSVRKASLRDVAEASGVSIQTVSRVVNASEAVAAETRDRVQEAIRVLGYQRNDFARCLLEGRSRMLGVVFAGHDYLGGREVNSGVTAEAEALGYSLLVKRHEVGQAGLSGPVFSPVGLDRQVDGILWMLHEDCPDYIPIVRTLVDDYRIPVVTLVMSRSIGVPYSAFDNFGAGVMATRHLLERGRRRIVHLAGPAGAWDAQERVRGFRHAMQVAGLPVSDAAIEYGNWLPQAGESGLHAVLARIPDLDAVFAANDNTALGAMLAAHRLGKRIPQDIAFVGVGDNRMAGWTYPPLSTIRQDQVRMGRQAVRMLSQLVEARFSGEAIPDIPDYLDAPELVIRESS